MKILSSYLKCQAGDFSSLVQEYPGSSVVPTRQDTEGQQTGVPFLVSYNTLVSTKEQSKSNSVPLATRTKPAQGQTVNTHKASTCDGVTMVPWTELFFEEAFSHEVRVTFFLSDSRWSLSIIPSHCYLYLDAIQETPHRTVVVHLRFHQSPKVLNGKFQEHAIHKSEVYYSVLLEVFNFIVIWYC